MAREFLRTFRQYEIEDVKKHLLISGDLTADCASCRALGLDPYTAAICPECGTPFKYMASRRVDLHQGERFQWAKRMSEKRPDLCLIDYGDYMKLLGQKQARDFFA